MDFPFDRVIERKGTYSLKYDFAERYGKPQNLLPLWVADMDFQTCPAVTDALRDAAGSGIFGYSECLDDYYEALRQWFSESYSWDIQREWVVKTPGVVFAICAAVRALTQKGDAVMIQKPVYYPFSASVLNNGRRLINNPLRYADGKYTVDFEDFEAKIVQNHVKLFILCSPHNPVGRVWSKEELERMGDLCARHGVLVVSDEIHADFTYPGRTHRVFAGLKPQFAQQTVTCTSPSKSFNLAGLQISNIIIADADIRRKFLDEVARTGYSQLNTMGLLACRAAYSGGRPWLEGLKAYLSDNLAFSRRFLHERLPQVRLVEPEGTYLLWLDFRALNLTERQLEDLIVNRARLWLDRGTLFGQEGAGFERINIACPRAVLQKALFQLEQAVLGEKQARVFPQGKQIFSPLKYGVVRKTAP